MQKRTIKSLIALFGLGLLFSQNAGASMFGFGGTQSRSERVASQLANAPVDEAISLENSDHTNDGNSQKCLTFGKDGKNIGTFVSMAKNGCFPDGTQYPAISKIRQDFCIKNCTNGSKPEDKCTADDPQNLKDLCDRYCRNENLGNQSAHSRLSTCFANWGLTKPMSFEEAAAYEGKAKSGAAAQKSEATQSAGEIKDYKATVSKAEAALKAYFDAREQFEAEREKVVAATNALIEKVKDAQNEKAALIDAQISVDTLNKAEQEVFNSKGMFSSKIPLTPEQIEEVGSLPATALDLAEFKAKFTGALRAAVGTIVGLAKDAQSELGSGKFADVFKEAKKQHRLRGMARRAKGNTQEMKKQRIADESYEELDDSTKGKLGNENPMHKKRRKKRRNN